MRDSSRMVMQSLINFATRRWLGKYTNWGYRVLEVGCGPGQYRYAVKGKYIGIDVTSSEYTHGLPRTPDLLADANHLPFQDRAFDVVFFSNVFHYFGEKTEVLAEAVRVLRPGGYLLIFDYSRKTLEKLDREYAATSQGVRACVRSSEQWIRLLGETGLLNVTLSTASAHLLHRGVKWVLPRFAYFKILDGMEGAIVLVGEKPE